MCNGKNTQQQSFIRMVKYYFLIPVEYHQRKLEYAENKTKKLQSVSNLPHFVSK